MFCCRSLTSHATICKRHSHTLLETKHEKKGITITQLINNKILPHCTVERIPKSKWQYTRPTHEFHHFNLAFTFAIVKDSEIRSKELWWRCSRPQISVLLEDTKEHKRINSTHRKDLYWELFRWKNLRNYTKAVILLRRILSWDQIPLCLYL